MHRAVRLSLAVPLCALLLAVLSGPAHAGIWTPLASGTTDDITAIEYQGADRFWFATGSGKIFRRVGGSFVQEAVNPATVFRDIEFLGAVGIAVGTNGVVMQSTDNGDTWTPVTIPDGGSATEAGNCGVSQPLGDVDSVHFDGNGHPWLIAGGSQIFTSSGSGALGTWSFQNGSGTCRINEDMDDAFFIPGSTAGYFAGKNFGGVFFTANGLTSGATKKPASAGNGYVQTRRLAGDPGNPNRQWAVAPNGGDASYFQRTENGWNTATGWDIANPSKRDRTPATDVDFSGGTVLAAGSAGMILHSVDGRSFYFDDADGALATADWLSVGLASGSAGAVGGAGGALAVSTAANVTPGSAPAPGFVLTGKGNAVSARRNGSKILVIVKGRLKPPTGVSAKQACRGSVKVTVRKGKKKLLTRTAKVKSSCRFGATLKLAKSKAGKASRLNVGLRFTGNSIVRATTKSLSVRIKG